MITFTENYFHAEDGLCIYYRDYGSPKQEKIPVLCLPGLTRNSKDFHRTAARLSKERRVLAIDYRGRGKSARDPDPHNYIPTTYLNDIRHLLALAGIHKVIIIGTSLGGLLAMGMAAAYPRILCGVILNDIGPELANSGRKRIIEYIGTATSPLNWDAAITELKSKFPSLSLQSDDDWRLAAEGTYRVDKNGIFYPDWDVNLVKPLLKSEKMPDLWPLFLALRDIPVLGIRGENSDILLPDCFERMATLHPNFLSVTIPKTGHVPSLWEPQSIKAINLFLSEI